MTKHDDAARTGILQVLGETLPLGDDQFRLEVSEPADFDDDGALKATLRLTTYGDDGGVWDLKEQPVTLAEAGCCADASRLSAYLLAWSRSLPSIVGRLYRPGTPPAMPAGLVFPELLADAGLRTEEEFHRAFSDQTERLRDILCRRAERELVGFLEGELGRGDPRVERLRSLAARPSIELLVTDAALEECPVGASRLGGLPDLPADLAWPQSGGQALTFIAQFNLAEVRQEAGGAAAELPATGWLFFFFGLQGWDVSDPSMRGGGRVLFSAGPAGALARRSPPADTRQPEILPTRTVGFEPRRLLPPLESPFYPLQLQRPARDPLEARGRAFEEFGFLAPLLQPTLESGEERPRDKLLGYADPLQADVYAQCVEASRQAGEVPVPPANHAEAAGWTLLFQADSDAEGNVLLGDSGLLDFLIRSDDLAQRNFDRVWTVWQSC